MSAKVLGMLHTYQIGVLDAADSVDEADADAVVCVCVCVHYTCAIPSTTILT